MAEVRQAFWMNPNALRIRTTRRQGVYLGPRALGAIRADYLVCSTHEAQRTQKLNLRHIDPFSVVSDLHRNFNCYKGGGFFVLVATIDEQMDPCRDKTDGQRDDGIFFVN